MVDIAKSKLSGLQQQKFYLKFLELSLEIMLLGHALSKDSSILSSLLVSHSYNSLWIFFGLWKHYSNFCISHA